MDDYCEIGPKGKGKIGAIHPVLLNWAIAFLAQTSARKYNKVAKVMKLLHISYIYKKTTAMVHNVADKCYAININTIWTVGEWAKRENWTSHQKTGVLVQDSCSLSVGIEHDYVINTLVGGDESHIIGGLSHMFQLLAPQVRDANEEEASRHPDDTNGPSNKVS